MAAAAELTDSGSIPNSSQSSIVPSILISFGSDESVLVSTVRSNTTRTLESLPYIAKLLLLLFIPASEPSLGSRIVVVCIHGLARQLCSNVEELLADLFEGFVFLHELHRFLWTDQSADASHTGELGVERRKAHRSTHFVPVSSTNILAISPSLLLPDG